MIHNGYILGIDPGERTGLCLYCGPTETILELRTIAHNQARQEIKAYYERGVRLLTVELSENTHIYERANQTIASMRRIAQNVGECKQKARELIAYGEGLGMEVIPVAPYATRMKAEQFNLLYKWSGRTSPHARVAAMVAARGWGKKMVMDRLER